MNLDKVFLLSAIPKKDRLLFLSLIILLVALPLTIFLAKKSQDIRPRAKVSGGPAKLFLSPEQQVQTGQSFNVDLLLNTSGKVVSGVEAHLSYPKDLLTVENININTTDFPTILKKEAAEGNIDIAVGISLNQ